MKKIFYGSVSEQGQLLLDDTAQFCAYLQTLKNKQIELHIGKRVRRRSCLQNNYYWGVIIKILSDVTGHDANEVHDAMKAMFLSYEDNGIRYIRSTSSLTTEEAMQYYEQVRRFASEQLNVYIPDPNEVIA